MNFSYIEFVGLVEERIFRPMIPVSFNVNDKNFKSYCLIDSGADYTILPIEAAKKLDLKLTRENSYRMEGAGANEFTIYASPSLIQCKIEKMGFRPITWQTKIYFSEGGTVALLGYKGFLEFFDVHLQTSQRKISLTVG